MKFNFSGILIVVLLLIFTVTSCSNRSGGSKDVSGQPPHQSQTTKDQEAESGPVSTIPPQVQMVTPQPGTPQPPINQSPSTVSFQSPNNPEHTIHIERKPATSINQPSRFNEQGVPIGNEVGNDIGDFVNYNPDSVLMRLSDLRGKMVMVMLWNSLCHHCIVDNEKYREIFNKYHNKKFVHGDGFDIYAIGLDKERETWLKALRERQYPWKNNVYVIDSWKDRDVRFFGVKNLPGTFLIDRNGIILHKLFTPEQLDNILQGYLLR